MSYEVFTTRKAEKAIIQLPEDVYERMNAAIDERAGDPRPPGCTRLSGRDGCRIRVGDYRAIYRVDDRERRVEMLRVAHRGSVYDS